MFSINMRVSIRVRGLHLVFPRKGVLLHYDLLVPFGSGWVSAACFPSSFFGADACLASFVFFLSSGKGFCSIMICWFLLVPAGVPVLVSFFSLLWFGACLLFSLFFLS